MIHIAKVKNDIVGLKLGYEENKFKGELSILKKGTERSQNKLEINIVTLKEIEVMDATPLITQLCEQIKANEETIEELKNKLEQANKAIGEQRTLLAEKDADLQRSYRNDADRKVEAERARRKRWFRAPNWLSRKP
jgi:hypothetical protein